MDVGGSWFMSSEASNGSGSLQFFVFFFGPSQSDPNVDVLGHKWDFNGRLMHLFASVGAAIREAHPSIPRSSPFIVPLVFCSSNEYE